MSRIKNKILKSFNKIRKIVKTPLKEAEISLQIINSETPVNEVKSLDDSEGSSG